MDTDSILPFLLSDPCESVFIRGYQFSSYFFLHRQDVARSEARTELSTIAWLALDSFFEFGFTCKKLFKFFL